MARKKKNTDQGPIVIDITPLIDCVFLLIVFFVVAGKFKKVEHKLNAYLPKDVGIDTRSEPDPDKFFIAVFCMHDQKAGKMRWKVNNNEVETREDLIAEITKIRDESGNKKNIKVTIDGDPQVDFFWIVASLDACAAADLTEVIFTPPRIPLNQWPQPTPKNIPLLPPKKVK